MEREIRLTKEEVDKEIKKLEKSRANGLEDTDLYNLKKENLNTIKQMVLKGEKEWRKMQESRNPQPQTQS